MRYIIGVDIGTSGTKAVAYTVNGSVPESSHIAYPPLLLQPGYHELDPALLLSAVISSINAVISKMNREDKLSGVCFSCAMHSLIAVGKNDQPLTNAITWADTRSNSLAEKLKSSDLGNSIYEHTGTPIHPMSPLCKIIWLKENASEIFSKTAKFIGIKEYIFFLFFGKYIIDHSIASATGLFDIRKLEWYDKSLQVAAITPEQLSQPVSATHMETDLSSYYQNQLGIKENIPFIIGASDGCLANLGSNAVLAGDASLTIGTSGALRMISAIPKHDSKQRIFNYILKEGMYVSGGAVNNGGVVADWFVKEFLENKLGEEKNIAAAVQKTSAIKPGSDGLIFLPYLLGERAPVWNADARGVFFGINPKHGSLHFLRAVIEGISFSLFQVCVSLEDTIGEVKQVYASGGFVQSELWLQMIADIFNKKVLMTNTTDASAIGAAIMGFYALNLINDLSVAKNLIKVDRIFEPDVPKHKIYQENFRIFLQLYTQLKTQFTEITNLQQQTVISSQS